MSTLTEDPVLRVLGTPDLLELIFTHLNPADVKHARLVSRLWSSVIERPKFWRWARISLARRGQELLSCRVLHLVEITVCPEAEESLRRRFITALADGTISRIQKVVFSGSRSSVEPEILSRNRFSSAFLTPIEIDQLSEYPGYEFLSQIKADQPYRALNREDVYKLYWTPRYEFLSSIEPELLSSAVVRVKECGFEDCALNTRQLITAIAHEEDLRLTSLDISRNSLEDVETDDLVRAILRLEKISMTGESLEQNQINQLFDSIVNTSRENLPIELQISSCDLSSVSASHLVEALRKFPRLRLNHETVLTPEQIDSICFAMISGDLKFKTLLIDKLHLAAPDVFSKAVITVEEADFDGYGRVSPEQAFVLCKTIINTPQINLKRLKIRSFDFQMVSQEIMKRVKARLHHLDTSDMFMANGVRKLSKL